MSDFIKTIFKNELFSLSECKSGFWLYDYVLSQNISMRAKDEQSAFIEALTYYQKKLSEYKLKHGNLMKKIDKFIEEFEEFESE